MELCIVFKLAFNASLASSGRMGNTCVKAAEGVDIILPAVVDDVSPMVSSEEMESPLSAMWSPHSGFSTMSPPSPRTQRIYDLMFRSFGVNGE